MATRSTSTRMRDVKVILIKAFITRTKKLLKGLASRSQNARNSPPNLSSTSSIAKSWLSLIEISFQTPDPPVRWDRCSSAGRENEFYRKALREESGLGGRRTRPEGRLRRGQGAPERLVKWRLDRFCVLARRLAMSSNIDFVLMLYVICSGCKELDFTQLTTNHLKRMISTKSGNSSGQMDNIPFCPLQAI